ncbi:MAG: CheW protein [Massilibacillus sp.]|jgi:purine-binding chemotaxis protein CheW|nr:CheW protein [Massilibacillus sp.]
MAKDINDFYEEDTQKGKFLTFGIGREVYGLEISVVTEIISIQKITEMPEVPEYIKGIINLRGKIIPVMDVRLRFKKAFREYNERTCIIVVQMHELAIGFIVDDVSEVIFMEDDQIVAKPDIKSAQNQYIKNIGKVGDEIKLILDCEKMLDADDEVFLMELK